MNDTGTLIEFHARIREENFNPDVIRKKVEERIKIGNMTKALKMILVIFLTTFCYLSSCSAFMLTENCPAPSPCSCYSYGGYSDISCTSLALTEIPDIKASDYQVSKLYLYFEYNIFTIVRDNAFKNISSFNATDIYLRLDDNSIHTISDNAFLGLENGTRSLNLAGNNLTSIPFAIGKLVNLERLDISNNPLHSVDASAMSNIGGSLTFLYLDMGSFTEWPKEFHNLRVLDELKADYIPFTHVDVDAFQGFEATLTHLTLDNSKLETLPSAICRLTNLTTLFFTNEKL